MQSGYIEEITAYAIYFTSMRLTSSITPVLDEMYTQVGR